MFLSNYNVYFNKDSFQKLDDFIIENKVSSVFVLVDQNTKSYCLNIFNKQIKFDYKTISISAGEVFKTLETCSEIWEKLSDEGADRKSLLINLGGGVVTDIGGFTASCFRRGITFIHIPTSLLGMVDAAIGGKNGVDFKNLKNQIGIIRNPEIIYIDKAFLKTLPKEQIVSGFAEILKHGLINTKSDEYFYECLKVKEIEYQYIKHLIDESIEIKTQITSEDAEEKGLRKVLNYGHTLGHAIESYRMSLESSKHLLHGEAIAVGLVLETFISYKIHGFPKHILNELKSFIQQFYKTQSFSQQEQKTIIDLMKYDKKNVKSQVNFVLLKDIGQPILDCQVDNVLIEEAFEYYTK